MHFSPSESRRNRLCSDGTTSHIFPNSLQETPSLLLVFASAASIAKDHTLVKPKRVCHMVSLINPDNVPAENEGGWAFGPHVVSQEAVKSFATISHSTKSRGGCICWFYGS